MWVAMPGKSARHGHRRDCSAADPLSLLVGEPDFREVGHLEARWQPPSGRDPPAPTAQLLRQGPGERSGVRPSRGPLAFALALLALLALGLATCTGHAHASGDLLQHLAGLEEPVDELVDLHHRRTGPVRNPQPS